jgi:hypothetical protein
MKKGGITGGFAFLITFLFKQSQTSAFYLNARQRRHRRQLYEKER